MKNFQLSANFAVSLLKGMQHKFASKDATSLIKEVTKAVWETNFPVSKLALPIEHCWKDPKDMDWDRAVPYEDYMKAIILDAKEGETGTIIVKFPAECSESNTLHNHPISDRVITVYEGSGTFVYVKNGTVRTVHLLVGDTVFMPRGVLHTFLAGKDGMIVSSIHNPYIPIEHPKCLVEYTGDKWSI